MFHDVRWGARHDGRFLWVLLNSGSCGAYAFNHDVDQPGGRPQLPPARGLLPRARRHVRRRRAFPARSPGPAPGSTGPAGSSWTSAAASRSPCPTTSAKSWWRGTTRQWPFMAADLGCSMETIMAHYMSNHIAVAYGDIFGEMVALSQSLGFQVRILSSQRHRSKSIKPSSDDHSLRTPSPRSPGQRGGIRRQQSQFGPPPTTD